jgi:hypothetical protein
MRCTIFWSRLRAAMFILLLCALSFSFQRPVKAAPAAAIQLRFEIAAVEMDETVTIRAEGFPIRTEFNVRMDVAGREAVNGLETGTFNTESSSKLTLTFVIPEELRGKRILAIRVDSPKGYTAHNWFFNRSQALEDPEAPTPSLSFSDVKSNQSVAVSAENLPPNTIFRVRVGPHYSFFRDYVAVDSVKSDENGALSFTLALPKAVLDSDFVAVHLDAGRIGLQQTFQNSDGGSLVAANTLVRVVHCQVLSVNNVPSLAPGEHFDAIWRVQNTSGRPWPANSVQYAYQYGAGMHQLEPPVHNLSADIAHAQVFPVIIDMVAPQQPGYYAATWALTRDGEQLCRMGITIHVKN